MAVVLPRLGTPHRVVRDAGCVARRLVRRSDLALHAAKRASRDRLVASADLGDEVRSVDGEKV